MAQATGPGTIRTSRQPWIPQASPAAAPRRVHSPAGLNGHRPSARPCRRCLAPARARQAVRTEQHVSGGAGRSIPRPGDTPFPKAHSDVACLQDRHRCAAVLHFYRLYRPSREAEGLPWRLPSVKSYLYYFAGVKKRAAMSRCSPMICRSDAALLRSAWRGRSPLTCPEPSCRPLHRGPVSAVIRRNVGPASLQPPVEGQ